MLVEDDVKTRAPVTAVKITLADPGWVSWPRRKVIGADAIERRGERISSHPEKHFSERCHDTNSLVPPPIKLINHASSDRVPRELRFHVILIFGRS